MRAGFGLDAILRRHDELYAQTLGAPVFRGSQPCLSPAIPIVREPMPLPVERYPAVH
jgi:hypothetical protein